MAIYRQLFTLELDSQLISSQNRLRFSRMADMTSNNYSPDTVVAFIRVKDYEQLFDYVKPFAESGVSDAECELGNIYMLGLGVSLDLTEAERWLMKAAQQNNPVAWNNLGTLYCERDPLKAKQCYKRAAELGFLSAAFLSK